MKNENVYRIDNNTFITIIKNSRNTHEALTKMGLNSRGASYKTFNQRCKKLNIDLSHFTSDKIIRKNISQETIDSVCSQSISRQETLKKLGLNPHTGANINWINNKLKNTNKDHWLGEGHLKDKTHNWASAKPLSEILIENSSYLWNAALKKRLLKTDLLKYKCYKCGISDWLGIKLSLQLEHRNGDHTDNRIENLCLLCPNCHSQTNTFAGKNIGRNGRNRTDKPEGGPF